MRHYMYVVRQLGLVLGYDSIISILLFFLLTLLCTNTHLFSRKKTFFNKIYSKKVQQYTVPKKLFIFSPLV